MPACHNGPVSSNVRPHWNRPLDPRSDPNSKGKYLIKDDDEMVIHMLVDIPVKG